MAESLTISGLVCGWEVLFLNKGERSRDKEVHDCLNDSLQVHVVPLFLSSSDLESALEFLFVLQCSCSSHCVELKSHLRFKTPTCNMNPKRLLDVEQFIVLTLIQFQSELNLVLCRRDYIFLLFFFNFHNFQLSMLSLELY